jgi:hypothetical protein
VSGPPRRLLGGHEHEARTPDDRAAPAGPGEPARPYVPRRDSGRTRAPSVGHGSRSRTPPPPFFGRGTTDGDDAWQVVRVRDSADEEHRDRARDRSIARRWQAIEIGFEEWGRGALVLVGVPHRPTRSAVAGLSVGVDARSDDASPTAAGIDAEPASGAASAEGAGDEAEMVAVALETIALRVRVGEFRVRGLVPGMTDPAILAATLASILAPRR